MPPETIISQTVEDPAVNTVEGGDPAPAAVPDPTPTGTPAEPIAADWKTTLPQDLRDDPSLQMIHDVPALAKSFIHAQKSMGAKKLALPGEGASKDEWKEVYKKLGLPETAESYKFEGLNDELFDEGFQKEFAAVSHENNINPLQAQGLLKWYEERMVKQQETVEKDVLRKQADSQKFLKNHFGMAYAPEIQKAQAALRELSGDNHDEFSRVMEKTRIGDEPTFIMMMAKVGEMLKEAGVVGEGIHSTGRTPEIAAGEWKDIENDKTHAYWDTKNSGNKKAREEVTKLFAEMHPSS